MNVPLLPLSLILSLFSLSPVFLSQPHLLLPTTFSVCFNNFPCNAFPSKHDICPCFSAAYSHLVVIIIFIRNLYTGCHTSIITSEVNSPFLYVGRMVLQGDCFNPLLLNLCFKRSVQHINVQRYSQFGPSTWYCPRSSFVIFHLFQFADDAAVSSCQEQEN